MVLRQQRLLMVGSVIAGALLLSFGMGWGLANDGLLAMALLLLPGAVFAGIIVLLLATRPFVTFCLHVAILTTIPLVRVYLPSDIPLYMSDLLLGLALVGGLWQFRHGGLRPVFPFVNLCVMMFALSVLLSSFVLTSTVGGAIQVVYAVGRYLLSTVLVFWAAIWLADTPERQRWLVIVILLGGTVNALLSIIQNLPGIQVWGVELPRMLYGSRSVPDARYQLVLQGQYRRGFGFYQSATSLSGVLDMALVLCMMGGRAIFTRQSWVNAIALLLLTGMLATYSRHGILSLVLVGLVGIFVLPNTRILVRLVVTMAVLGTLVMAVGLVDLNYLTSRSENVLEDQSTMARVEGMNEFITYSIEEPQRIIIGNGVGWADLFDRGLLSAEEAEIIRSGFVSNAYPLVAYNVGVLGLLSYMGLFGYLIYRSVEASYQHDQTLGGYMALGLATALIMAAILHPFDNYFTEAGEVRAWFWLLMGLATSVLLSLHSNERGYYATPSRATSESRPHHHRR
jgi:hypothetical protein